MEENNDAMVMIGSSPFITMNSDFEPKLGSYAITTNFELYPPGTTTTASLN
jgi:hypothetical protein